MQFRNFKGVIFPIRLGDESFLIFTVSKLRTKNTEGSNFLFCSSKWGGGGRRVIRSVVLPARTHGYRCQILSRKIFSTPPWRIHLLFLGTTTFKIKYRNDMRYKWRGSHVWCFYICFRIEWCLIEWRTYTHLCIGLIHSNSNCESRVFS